jgi:hypothetical protein
MCSLERQWHQRENHGDGDAMRVQSDRVQKPLLRSIGPQRAAVVAAQRRSSRAPARQRQRW